MKAVKFLLLEILITINVHFSFGSPQKDITEVKAAYKAGEISGDQPPITINMIKERLKSAGVFDWQDKTLTAEEKKELAQLFDAVEIMTTSRARQPINVQTIFSSLRVVERAVKKMFKEKQISDSLVNKFDWDRLNNSDLRKINA